MKHKYESLFRIRPSFILNWLNTKGQGGKTLVDGFGAYLQTKGASNAATLSEALNQSLSSLGFTGTLGDKLNSFYIAKTGIGNPVDAEMAFYNGTGDFSGSATPFTIGYTGTTNSNAAVGPPAAISYKEAQSFVLSASSTITDVSLKFLANVGAPTGTMTLRIETDSAGAPSGTLAHANLTVNFTPTASSVNSVNFASSATIAAGTYWFVQQTTAAQSAGNYWNLGIMSGNPYASGVNAYYNGTVWANNTGYDEYFTITGTQ